MTVYGFVLFVHIVFAILLVGGTAWLHVATHLIGRSRTVDGVRSHVAYISAVSKASMPIAMVTLAAGLYMAFAGSHWGAGWPAVSLILFAIAGVSAGAVIDPAVARIKATIDEMPDGPMTPAVGAALADPRLTFFAALLTGADLAIVFLMTNKPGWTGSTAVALIGLALGAAMGMRENRQAAAATGAASAA